MERVGSTEKVVTVEIEPNEMSSKTPYQPQTPQPQLPIKKSSITTNGTKKSNKSSKHYSTSSNSAYQTPHQNRSEPPFPLYSTTTVAPSHDEDDNVDGDDKDVSLLMVNPTPRILHGPTLEQGWNSVVQLLRGRKRIAILTGAGISVSCGIPDFRTKGSGLYSTLDTAVRTTCLCLCVCAGGYTLVVSYRHSSF